MKTPPEMKGFRVVHRLVVVAFILAGVFFSVMWHSRPQLSVALSNTSPSRMSRNDKAFGMLQPGYVLFEEHCKRCHRLQGTEAGGSLLVAYQQRDSVWLRRMIVDGMALVREGDEMEVKLYNQYNKIPHPNFTQRSEQEISELIDYLKWESEEGRAVPW